jgi:signal peptide peptidase SppA
MSETNRLLAWVQNTPWAMTEEMGQTMLAILARHQDGIALTAEELQAAISPDGSQTESITPPDKVAILRLFGVMANRANMVGNLSGPGGTSVERFQESFLSAVNDPEIAAIVIDTNSPGGSVYGVEELANTIYSARGAKPIIAHVNHFGASAAYHAISQADEIVLAPGSEVGSTSVFSLHEDVSKMMEMKGIKHTILRADEYKAEGSGLEPFTESAKKYGLAKVKLARDMMVGQIARGRGKTAEYVVANFGRGRMLDAQKAIAVGAADRIATMRELLAGLGERLSRQNGAAGNGLAASETPPDPAVQPDRQNEENAMDEAAIKAAVEAQLQGIGDIVKASVAAALPAALKPLEDKVDAQDARIAESEKRAAHNLRVEKLDALVRAGRITPAERKSEETLLAHLPGEVADQRLAEMGQRSPRLVSRLTGPVHLSDESPAAELTESDLRAYLLPQQDVRCLDPTKLEIVAQAKAQSAGDPKKFREIAYALSGEVQ